MAVLCQAVTVVAGVETIEAKYPHGLDGFLADSGGKRYSDGVLAAASFMSPADVKRYVDGLTDLLGFEFVDENQAAMEIVVIDQQSGPTALCDWVVTGAYQRCEVGVEGPPRPGAPDCLPRMGHRCLRIDGVHTQRGGRRSRIRTDRHAWREVSLRPDRRLGEVHRKPLPRQTIRRRSLRRVPQFMVRGDLGGLFHDPFARNTPRNLRIFERFSKQTREKRYRQWYACLQGLHQPVSRRDLVDRPS